MAITDQTISPPKGPSLVIQIAVLLVVTAAAVGLGWGAGMYLQSENGGPTAEASAAMAVPGAHEAAAGHGEGVAADAHGGGEGAEGGKPGGELLVALAPMTTNLAAPNQIWVRLEASVIFDMPQPPEMIETIHQDLLAYLRTVKMHQIEGASGYQHLKADLEERARIRSDGHVKQLLIRTLLLE